MGSGLLVEQKRLGMPGLVALITVLNMTAPLSTDMYLPSFPTLIEYFDTSKTMLNYTLVGFFFFFAVGMLLFGPFSDRYGRKPVLVAGLAVYAVSSLFCASATSVWQLVVFRVVQALGAGCMVSVSTALVKDCFDGQLRGTILATIQSMAVVAPVLAPNIGSLILKFASWRATFVVLCCISTLLLVAACLLDEPLAPENRQQGSMLGIVSRMIAVGKNRSFTGFLSIVALLPVGFMAYISVSPYIYVEFFGLSESAYSLFFGANAAVSVLAPLTYIRLSARTQPRRLITLSLGVALCSGAAILLAGRLAPLVFLLTFMPFTFSSGLIRPLATNILLNQQETDTGSASALINFGNTVMGSLGMTLGTLPWPDVITGLGVLTAGASALALCGWFLFQRSSVELKGVKPAPASSAP